MKLWAPRALPLSTAVLGIPTLLAPGSAGARLTYAVAFCVIVVASWAAARAAADHRVSRALIAGALTAWFAGDLLYSVLTWWFGELGDISVADIFWITGYPLLAAGLIIMVRERASGRLREATLDGLAMATVVGALLWQFMVQPEITGYAVSPAAVIGVFYPLGDVLLFVAGALLVLAPDNRRGPTGFLVTALTITFLGDVVIAALSTVMPGFDTERLDALLLLANSMFAAALWSRDTRQPAEGAEAERVPTARLIFLGIALITLPVLNQLHVQDGILDRIVPLAASVLLTTIIFVRFVLVVRDQEQARSALAHRATHDDLTGLINRKELHARLAEALRHRQGDGPVVHFLDLDGFKAVNDRYGHSAGDFLLTEVARRLRRQTRPADIVARLGGDEFVVVTEDAADMSARLRDALRAEIPFQGHQLTVDVSIGLVSAADFDHPDPDTLLAAADECMYRKKHEHRDSAAGQVDDRNPLVTGLPVQ